MTSLLLLQHSKLETNPPALQALSLRTPAFFREQDPSPDVVIFITHMFGSLSPFPNVILSADASPCFSIVVSSRP